MKKEQFIHVDSNGTKRYYSDREHENRHREDGPAVEYENGDKGWYINGKLHREDGPAVEWADGTKSWWFDGKCHREDGPAVVWSNGDKEWWVEDELHREDGPAGEFADGSKEWWVNGEKLTEAEFNARMNPVELTLEDIAEKFGVSVDRIKVKK